MVWMRKMSISIAVYFLAKDCVFKDGRYCALGARRWCHRPCRFYLRSSRRLSAVLPSAAFVVGRVNAQTSHLLALVSLVVSLCVLVLGVLRFALFQ